MQLARDIQAEIRKIDGNMQCVDCSAKLPQWASVSYGTLFCLECSGQHRSLGVHLSFVRSIQMDSWTEKQIQTLKVGGNKKMKDFFEKYQVPATLSITQKYKTVQAEHYRDRIVALRDGKPAPSVTIPIYKPPSPRADGLSEEEAARQRMRARFGPQSGLGSRQSKPKSGADWGKLRAGFSSAFSSAATVTGKWTTDIKSKTGQWAQDIKTKVDESNLNEKLTTENATNSLKSGWSWLSKGAYSAWNKASDGIKNMNQTDDEPFKLYRTEKDMREDAGAPKLYREGGTTSSPKSNAKSGARSNKSKRKAPVNKQTKKSSNSDQTWGDDWGDDWNDASAASAKAPAPASASAPASTITKKDDAWEKDLLDLGEDELELKLPLASPRHTLTPSLTIILIRSETYLN